MILLSVRVLWSLPARMNFRKLLLDILPPRPEIEIEAPRAKSLIMQQVCQAIEFK